jgi:simple sugar transport system permease protein
MSFNKTTKDIIYSIAAIVLALIVGAILIKVSGNSITEAYYYLFYGAFGSTYNIAQTLLKTIPLIFAGLAVAVGFQSGLFNIGGEGQLYWGAFATALVAITFTNLPSIILIPLALAVGAVAGALWAAVPGILRAKTGAHEVITTIMFNYIGILLTTFLLKNYFKEDGPVDQTRKIAEQAKLPEIVANTRLSWALFIAIIVVIIIYYLLNYTSYGYDLQLVGENIDAAEYSGVNSDKVIINAMLLSGGIAGLTGSTMVLGVLHRFITNFSPGYGFTGIAVAVLGQNKPLGVLLAAFLFGILEAGGMSMQLFAKIPADLMTIVQGLVILFAAAPSLFKILKNKSLVFRGGN